MGHIQLMVKQIFLLISADCDSKQNIFINEQDEGLFSSLKLKTPSSNVPELNDVLFYWFK